MTAPRPRNAQAEADAVLGGDLVARVLEPSPPADDSDPSYLADDPTDAAAVSGTTVSPVSDGDRAWHDVAAADPTLEVFARDRWLGPRRRLTPLPPSFDATRDAVHQLAYFAVSPARYRATGKLGLRWTRGGLGTPFFSTPDGDVQVRLEGRHLVRQVGERTVDHATPTSVGAACAFLGIPYEATWFADFRDPLDPVGPDLELTLDDEALQALDDWFGFGTAVLEELRRTDGAADVTRVQLWPEHLDPAVELGRAEAEQRASYGASPGDADHEGPYLYVSPWFGRGTHAADEFWNDDGFGGASLSYADLLAADDQFATALAFFRRGHDLLTS